MKLLRVLRRRLRHASRPALVWSLIIVTASASLPAGLLPTWLPLPAPRAADAETLTSPRFASAALMPNGQVGLIFENQPSTGGEIRFVRYTSEHALAGSTQLSTAAPWYPQLAVLGTTLVAAYVDTRSPNTGKLVIRTSTDNGATWSAEAYPFGSETFDSSSFAPRLVASHAGTTLYLFTAANNALPQYRSTTDLSTWTTPAAAGDTSMRAVTANNCGSAGQECYRAHTFEFMETATAGSWVYVTKSDSGYGQSGRGTQVGALGGSWSTQVDHGGSGGLSGGGESTATTFLGRDNSIYYIRAGETGTYLYYKRSTDGGLTWGPLVQAYAPYLSAYTTAAPVGLFVPGYTFGEYVWYAGFGGSEDALRVVPLWTGSAAYARTGTTRLVGSAGGDIDAASVAPFNFADDQRSIGLGGYTTSHTDLALPGRVLPFAFTRTYNSADENRAGSLGPGWSHSYEWSVNDAGSFVTLKRGSGERDHFTRNVDGSYTAPPGVTDTLAKKTDGTFTLTTREQVQYEFGDPTGAYASAVTTASPVGYWRLGESSGTTAADSGGGGLSGTYAGTLAKAMPGALSADTNTSVNFGGGNVDMGSPSVLNITGTALTVEFWMQTTSYGAYRFMVSHTNGFTTGYGVYEGDDANVHFFIGRSGALHISGPVTGLYDGAWHHVVSTYDGAQMKIYVDAQLALAEAETGAISSYTGNFRVADYNGGGYPFVGTLDEVAVYARALSSSEIATHYALGAKPTGVLVRIHEPAGNQITLGYTGPRLSTITDTTGRVVSLGYDTRGMLQTLTDPSGRATRYGYDGSGRLAFIWDPRATATPYTSRVLADSPLAYWRLGESSGTTAADASGSGVSGTYAGVTLGVPGAIAGDTDTAITTNGSSTMTAAGSGSLNITGSAMTVEGWTKSTGPGTWAFLVSKTDDSTKGYAVETYQGGTLAFYVVTSGSGRVVASAPTSPWDNQWHHFAGTYDGSYVRLYVDGAQVAQAAASGTIQSSSTLSLVLGRYNPGTNGFAGSLDEVAITGSALSASEIANRPFGPPSWTYAYDGATRHLTSIKDPDGRSVVTNTFDSQGRLATQKDGLNKETDFGYSGSTLTITDPRLVQTTQTFDSRSRLLTSANTLGGTTYTLTYTYDDCGDVSSVTNRRGNRTDYTFDTACKGNLLTLDEPQIDPSTPRFETTWTYDARNNPTLRTDAKGFTTAWTYDSSSNVRTSETRQIDASTTAVTKWQYTDSANPGLATRVIAPRGNTTGTPDNTYSTVLAYDSSGNLISSTDADGNQTTYAYDSVGRRTSMVDPDGNVTGGTPSQHTWSTAYDVLDRVTSETDPLSHASSYTYDGAGHRLTDTDRNGNVTTYTYDSAGRLATVAQKPDPVGSPSTVYTTTVTRDDNGNATRVTQGNGVQTDYSFDALNRLTSTTTHPATGTDLVTALTLDGDGNVTIRHTADGVDTTYTYDNLDRLTQIAATGLSTIGYGYDELSRRTSMTDGTGTTTYSYDRLGRLTQAAQPSGTLSYGYDRDSNRTSLTYPGSLAVTYSFTSADRLSSLTDWGSRTSSYTYTPSGLAATVTLPGGMVTTYTYDRAQRLTNLTNVLSGTTITSHAYTVDAQGNRTALTEFVSGITTGSSDSFGFTYDGLERLTGATTTNAETFTLDGASNITARTGPSATYTIDGSNRPTSDGTNTLTWSAADRLTGRGSDSFGFDPLDRLTSSTVSGTSRSYAYSGDGLLQSRTTGGSTTNLLWDAATSPQRLLVSGSDLIVYGLGPLYRVNGTTVTTFARDGQKSVRAELVGSNVTGSWRYRAYGDVVQSSGSSTPALLGYAGQLLDPSGLYYMRARWYDATNGRFVTRDPLATSGASNGFNYADLDPLSAADPTGLDPLLDPGSLDCGSACFVNASWKDANVGCFDAAVCHSVPVAAGRVVPLMQTQPLPLPNGILSANAITSESDAEVLTPTPPGPPTRGKRPNIAELSEHIRDYMRQRKWTPEQIWEAWRFGDRYDATNLIEDSPAVRYVHPVTGRSVVVDTQTGEVIHLGGNGFRY